MPTASLSWRRSRFTLLPPLRVIHNKDVSNPRRIDNARYLLASSSIPTSLPSTACPHPRVRLYRPPEHHQRLVPSAAQPYSPRHARPQAHQNPPILLSRIFAPVLRVQLPTLARVSHHFCAAVLLALYRTLELSAGATTEANVDACIAGLIATPHFASLVTTHSLLAYLPAHGLSFHVALRLALRSMRAFSVLTLPAFDVDLLAAVPSTLVRLTLRAEMLPFEVFDRFLAESLQTDFGDSEGSHHKAWSQLPRAAGGLGARSASPAAGRS